MSLGKITLGLSLVLSTSAFAFHHGQTFHRSSLLSQSNSIQAQALKLRADGTLRTQEVGFFDQKLDHASKSSATFKQRFFVDSQYASGPTAPVMYIICGEWNCAGTGSYSYVESLAKKLKAHLVALEHRFYGESLPTRKLTPEALKNLHLQAAIDDLATFQLHMMNERGLKGKWVSFGGSYAGTLSAFYREKHPELVVGALASSAPVLMKNSFNEYDAHVAKVINKTSCGDMVRAGVKAIEAKMATPEGALEVKKIFKATDVKNDNDFLYVVADMLAAAVQYGRDKVFCNALAASPDDLVKGYATGGLAVLSAMGETPFGISLAVAERVDITPDDNMRQWMWQSCREFGWFQVANTGTGTSRSSKIDLNYHNELCKRLYGKPMGKDGALNQKWYLPLFARDAGRIIFSNGSNDPWQTLSVTEFITQRNPEFDLYMMEGAAHCNDLRLGGLASVSSAQMDMDKIIAKWVE